MKLSKKNKQRILEAINDATKPLLTEHCPACMNSPPEEWNQYDKTAWDLITGTELAIEKQIKSVFNAK